MMSDEVDIIIRARVNLFDNSFRLDNNPSLDLLSMGELIDRLSIVNFKLFTLKNRVLEKIDDKEFCSWASVEDIKLVEERARLKKVIDQKLDQKICEILKDGKSSFNAESKSYG